MKSLFVSVFVLALMTTFSATAEVTSFKLDQNDGVSFVNSFKGLYKEKSYLDPRSSVVAHIEYSYQSENDAFSFFCAKSVSSGRESKTSCELSFDVSKSSPELEVYISKLGAYTVRFNSPDAVSQLNINQTKQSFESSQKVRVQLFQWGAVNTPRSSLACKAANNLSQSCTLIAFP